MDTLMDVMVNDPQPKVCKSGFQMVKGPRSYITSIALQAVEHG